MSDKIVDFFLKIDAERVKARAAGLDVPPLDVMKNLEKEMVKIISDGLDTTFQLLVGIQLMSVGAGSHLTSDQTMMITFAMREKQSEIAESAVRFVEKLAQDYANEFKRMALAVYPR